SSYENEARGAGWLIFAASMLGLAGILAVIDGIVALSKSKFYVADATYVFSDLRTWGWITLIIGAVTILAAMGVLAGSQFARWFGIIAAAVMAIDVFMFAQAYPLWTLLMFGTCVLVIYALAAYGGKAS
ncbi:MAG: DUF7144 family membrane protein, partial [Solirubrobacteraceae bacterium]